MVAQNHVDGVLHKDDVIAWYFTNQNFPKSIMGRRLQYPLTLTNGKNERKLGPHPHVCGQGNHDKPNLSSWK